MKQHHYNEGHVLEELRHYLPSQLSLKDFVHHNSLHAYQDKPFFDAIYSAKNTFGIQVTLNLNEYRKLYEQGRIKDTIVDHIVTREKGVENLATWKDKMLNVQYEHGFEPRLGRLRSKIKEAYKIDLDNLVQPLLFRIINSYLDQGIALWHFPFEDKGLLEAIKILEKNTFTSFFKNKRAKELLFKEGLSTKGLLDIIVGKEEFYENYIYDQQFGHRGWSGLVAAIEGTPNTLLYKKEVTLVDFITLELLLEIDAIENTVGKNWKPLGDYLTIKPIDYWSKYHKNESEEVLQLWQQAFEWDYYDEVLSGMQFAGAGYRIPDTQDSTFQAVFCIDDREDSLRRHLEIIDPKCKTFGAPGFFGIAMFYQPFGGKFYEKNCPVPAQPKHLIKEVDVKGHRAKAIIHSKNTHNVFNAFFISLSLGLWSAFRLVTDLFNPKMEADISDAFAHMNMDGKLLVENKDLNHIENGLQVGFTVPEMADIVYGILTSISMTSNFSRVVYIIAHGSSSANNPHHGAHDCGACSGRPGSINARAFAFMANHEKVREILIEKGITIPKDVQFVGGMHDTASDEVAFYDVKVLTKENKVHHKQVVSTFESALDQNAKERSRRFSSIDITKDIKHVRKAIKQRSVSYFEPRPELGHGTNALCYVGAREKVKGLFLDRRAFLQSYDYRNDPDGLILEKVLGPLPVVCGGINLEYYFSRMDIEKMGAGTKLPHNVMGLIGVANSSDGDLRPGLPLQMIENHDPVRLLMVIEHRPEVMLSILNKNASMKAWFDDEWLILGVISPDDNSVYYYNKGHFEVYKPIHEISQHTKDIISEIEQAKPMHTNYILDATKENMPVHVYQN